MAVVLSAARERALLYVLMALQFTVIVDFMILMPLSSQLMAVFHIQPGQFGLLVSSYSLAAGVSALIASAIADRFDRRSALIATYIGLLLATLGCALARSYEMLLVARIVAGFFGGVTGAVVLAIVGDIIPLQRRGQAMSIVMMAFSLAAVAGVPLGLYIANHFSWQTPFTFLVVVSIFVLVAVVMLVPSIRDHLTQERSNVLQSYRELFSVKNHWWGFITSCLIMFAGFMIIPYIAPTLVANVGLDEHSLPYIYLVGGAVTLISRPWIARLTDRHRPAHVLMFTTLASFVPIILVTQTLVTSLFLQLIIAALFFIFISGRFIPCSAMVTASCEPRFRGRVMAFNSAVQNLGSGLAALVAGAIMVKAPSGEILHFDWVGYLACAVSLLAIYVAMKIKTVS
ncbi:MAG TPA: MFS transporter [Cellvibrio sp.]|nr:MFS transporter [Cellvibrio sp.]